MHRLTWGNVTMQQCNDKNQYYPRRLRGKQVWAQPIGNNWAVLSAVRNGRCYNIVQHTGTVTLTREFYEQDFEQNLQTSSYTVTFDKKTTF